MPLKMELRSSNWVNDPWLWREGGGALLKNRWRGCAATLNPLFKPPVTEWPLFIFQLALTDVSHSSALIPIENECSHWMAHFIKKKKSCLGNALTEWPLFSKKQIYLFFKKKMGFSTKAPYYYQSSQMTPYFYPLWKTQGSSPHSMSFPMHPTPTPTRIHQMLRTLL